MVGYLLLFALRQRLLVIALGLALVGVGAYVFMNLRVEAYPDISDTQAVVISLYPGHAAEEVEQQVTVPIERALKNVPRVIARRSRTIFGLSVVEMTFADPTDDYFARQLVMEKLRDAVLPAGVTPSLGPLTSGIGEMYRYRLEGADHKGAEDTMKLREVQDWVVIPRLLQVPGVADVAPFGGLVKQFQIEVDPLELEKYSLSVKRIAEAISANNQNAGGAQLDNRQQSLVVRGVGLIQSVSDVENIVHRLEEREREGGLGDATRAVQAAALEMAQPIFFSLAIIVAAYIPLFTMQRVERRLFGPMAFTVASALLGSLILSLTLIPVLATWLFRRGAKSWENPPLRWLAGRYEQLLRVTLRRAVLTVSVALALVAASFLLARALGTEFLPQLDEGVIWIRANLPPGISLQKSCDVARQMRAIIKQSPEVRNVMSQSGRNDSGTDPFGPNRNELLIGLQPYDTWPPGRTKRDLVEELGQRLRAAIPGATLSFTQPIIDTSTEMATGSSADLAVIINGPDLKKLRELARQTLAMLRRTPGAADTSIEQEDEQAQLRIRVKRDEVARYGINVSDVQDVIELAIGGRAVCGVFEGERKFDLALRYAPEARADAEAIGRVLIPTPDGGRVPLAQLAEITVANGATIIARRENQRQITVRANIRGRDQGSFVEEAQKSFEREVKLPESYQVAWGGMFENLERARRRLYLILPVTIALIFGLLFSAFGKSSHAGLVLMSVPFSLVGGVVALWVRGVNLSVSAAVGFISLFGVAVMSGVLVVAEINRQREAGVLGVREAVIQGALKQMRPVLMMIAVAMLGMIPAARATGIGSDVQRPLATVVVGGLLSTLFLTLLALPSLYYLMNRPRDRPRDEGCVQESVEFPADDVQKAKKSDDGDGGIQHLVFSHILTRS